MKTLVTFALISLMGTAVLAQDKDPKAKAILDKVSAKYNAYKTLTIDFEVTLKGDGVNEKIVGKAQKQDKKYTYDTQDYKVVCDGRSVWTYVKSDNQVTITSASADENAEDESAMLNPTKLLTIWETGFKYKLVGNKTVNGKKTKEIRLFPENPKKVSFHTITLFIEEASNEIVQIKVKSRDGITMTYSLKKMEGNKELAQSNFKFDKSKYPGIEENDLRF